MLRTCIEIKSDGVQCGSPALRNNLRCHWHARRHVTRVLNSPAYRESILSNEGRLNTINHIVQALLYGQLDAKAASSALYGIQVAREVSSNQDFDRNHPAFKILLGSSESTR